MRNKDQIKYKGQIFIFEDERSELKNMSLNFFLHLIIADLNTRHTEQVHWKIRCTDGHSAQGPSHGFWMEKHLQIVYFGQRLAKDFYDTE